MDVALRRQKSGFYGERLPEVVSEDEGCRMLIAAKIAVAVMDAVGIGMTGLNREKLVDSAWAYLESDLFRHDLDLLGMGVVVHEFLRELKELTGDSERGRK